MEHSSLVRRAAGPLAIVVAIAVAYRDLLTLGFTDVDTYALLATGRFDTWERLVAVWTEPLMQGQMPNARFWRPVTSMSWGLDAWLWGTDARGTHATDLALHVANLWLFWRLVRRAAPAGVAWLAVLLFAVHPIGFEVVPAIARRADTLLALFLWATLLAVDRRARVATFALAALGMLAKATMVVGLPSAFLWLVCVRRAPWRDAARACLPIAVAIAVALGARVVVLGGLGGYDEGAEISVHGAAWHSLGTLLGVALAPGELEMLAVLGVPVWALAAVAAIGLAAGRAARPPGGRLAVFALAALAALIVVYALARTVAAPRGAYPAAALLSILLACGSFGVWSARTQPVQIVLGVVCGYAVLSTAIALVTGTAIASWRANANRIAATLDATARALDGVPDRADVLLVGYPLQIGWTPPLERPLLLEHSVQGWADLTMPERGLAFTGLGSVVTFAEDAAGTTLASFDPETATLELEHGPNAVIMARPWGGRHGRPSPWRPLAAHPREGTLRLALDPEAVARGNAWFLVYLNGGVLRRPLAAWTVP